MRTTWRRSPRSWRRCRRSTAASAPRRAPRPRLRPARLACCEWLYPTLILTAPRAGRARARAPRGRAPGGRGGLAPGGRGPAARRAALAQPAHAFLGLPGRHARAAGQRRARCAPRRPPPRRPYVPCLHSANPFTLYLQSKALLAVTARPRVLPWMGKSLARDGGRGRPRQRPSWRWRRCGTACAWSRAWPRRSWRARARPRCRCRAAVSCSTWPPPGPRRAPPAVRALSSGRPGLPARGRGA